MTMLLLTIDSERHNMRWASAGHDAPVIFDRTSGEFIEPEGGGLPLGIMSDSEYEEYVYADVRSGQIYFAATDGVWETPNKAGENFGKDRLREFIRRNCELSAKDMGDRLRSALTEFRGGDALDDDLTFVIVKVL
jgi:sigma-B regulation protein RsbU (phosphoserine phosphatase)